MAKKYYGLNIGQGIQDVEVDTSTTDADIEVVVNDANTPNEVHIKKGLDNIMAYIQQVRYNG